MQTKIKKAQEVLRLAAKMSKRYYKKPLIIAYSGGKDSDVLLDIACKCLDPNDFEVLNSHTTVDAPDTVYHIRKVFDKLRGGGGVKTEILMPTYKGEPVSMWSLIPIKSMPPTRLVRYCCYVLKETSTPNRFIALGVRQSESSKRHGRDSFGIRGVAEKFYSLERAEKVFEEAQKEDPEYECLLIRRAEENADLMCNPIYEWTDHDVWNYISENNIEVNPLYWKGYWRVGCIGCPFGTRENRLKEFSDFPAYKNAYIHAFDRMIKRRKEEGKKCDWETGQEVFDWWIGDDQVKGQMKLDLENV